MARRTDRLARPGPGRGAGKLTYYVTDLRLYRESLQAIGPVYRDVFGRHYPATTLIEVSSLFDPDAMVEIDAVAVRRA